MKAVCWHGRRDMRVDNVDDPKIEDPRDAIIRITATAICGSDLHLYNGVMPTMEAGDVVGHEPMGEVVEVGSAITNLMKGDRVVVPFTLACGSCFFCNRDLFSLCDNSNRNAEKARQAIGQSPSGMLGYSHMMGGYAGGQAEYLRVPYADVGPVKVPDGIPDEQVLFLSDIFPTGYMAAENCGIEAGDTVAVWGCGPVAQFAIQSAWMLGAGRVIAIDRVENRLELARTKGKAETIHFENEDVQERLMEMTKGRGPDCCIDAVGAEAHSAGVVREFVDDAREAMHVPSNHPYALAEAILCCRKGGTVSIPGVYTAPLSGVPMHAAMNKGLTMKMGQTHMQHYMKPLLEKVIAGEIDPSFIITHRGTLDDAPSLYETFDARSDDCVKVVLTP
ncbi:Glutathione-independent formaldehyde dehydrogenase [Rubripirellula amarantea]|uniref:Glutathione-independent formaldehyde dehydrogenase n=1 Tax=Rubripirellula amarantea TaxID=2527999 RepID=A0A5C5WW01_9BACT|nr:zinc-dependent alcohol dehydrogenase [Rubripirellula amarantea]TWT54866.1 Glutathione-independent formaldehyde dehydrogenase [Rubripirellula amarantea]